MSTKTRTELEEEVRELREQLQKLNHDINPLKLVREKTIYNRKAFFFLALFIIAIQSTFAALGLPSPFSSPFNLVLLAIAVVFLVGYLVQIALLLNRRFHISTRLSVKEIELSASTTETNNNETDQAA